MSGVQGLARRGSGLGAQGVGGSGETQQQCACLRGLDYSKAQSGRLGFRVWGLGFWGLGFTV